jgi:tRNA 2-thiouridine synthesizing protein A
MGAMAPGEILEVLATDPDVDLDVRAWSLRSGNQLLSLEREGPMFLIRVRRA